MSLVVSGVRAHTAPRPGVPEGALGLDSKGGGLVLQGDPGTPTALNVISISAVPEPSTFLTGGIAAILGLGLWSLGRRRRAVA